MNYKIIETTYDPVRPWQLICTGDDGKGMTSTVFRTYGEAWREMERRKRAESQPQSDMFAQATVIPVGGSENHDPVRTEPK
jgi:hypothetical protein